MNFAGPVDPAASRCATLPTSPVATRTLSTAVPAAHDNLVIVINDAFDEVLQANADYLVGQQGIDPQAARLMAHSLLVAMPAWQSHRPLS